MRKKNGATAFHSTGAKCHGMPLHGSYRTLPGTCNNAAEGTNNQYAEKHDWFTHVAAALLVVIIT